MWAQPSPAAVTGAGENGDKLASANQYGMLSLEAAQDALSTDVSGSLSTLPRVGALHVRRSPPVGRTYAVLAAIFSIVAVAFLISGCAWHLKLHRVLSRTDQSRRLAAGGIGPCDPLGDDESGSEAPEQPRPRAPQFGAYEKQVKYLSLTVQDEACLTAEEVRLIELAKQMLTELGDSVSRLLSEKREAKQTIRTLTAELNATPQPKTLELQHEVGRTEDYIEHLKESLRRLEAELDEKYPRLTASVWSQKQEAAALLLRATHASRKALTVGASRALAAQRVVLAAGMPHHEDCPPEHIPPVKRKIEEALAASMLASVAIETRGIPSRESIERAKVSLDEILNVETAAPYLGLQSYLPRVQQERKRLEDALDKALSVTSSESTGRQTPTYPGRSRSSSLRRPSTPLSSHIPWPHHEPGHFGHERRPSRASFGPSEDGRGTLPLPGVPRSPATRLPQRSATLPRAPPGWQPHPSMMQQLRGSSRPPSRGATLPRQRSQSLPRTIPGQQQPQINMQQLSEGSRPTDRAATLPTQHPGQQQPRSSMLPVLRGPHTPRPTPVKPPRKSKQGPQAGPSQAVSPPQEPQTHPAAAPTGIQTPSAGDTSSLPAPLPATSDGHPAGETQPVKTAKEDASGEGSGSPLPSPSGVDTEKLKPGKPPSGGDPTGPPGPSKAEDASDRPEDGAASGGDGAPSERKEPPPSPPGDGQQPPGDSPPPPPPGGKPTPPGEDPPPPEQPPKKDEQAATQDTELEKKLKDLATRMTTFSASAAPVASAAAEDRFTHPMAEDMLKEGLQLFQEAEQLTSTHPSSSPLLMKVVEQKEQCRQLCSSLHTSVSKTWEANLRAKKHTLESATRNAEKLRQSPRGRFPSAHHMGLLDQLCSLVEEAERLVKDLTPLNSHPVRSGAVAALIQEVDISASVGHTVVTAGVRFCASECIAALEEGTGGADLLQQAISAHSQLSTLRGDAPEVSDLEKAITSKGGTISKS
ncbi:uncharacterized protein EMH_0044400 [Eimeria mitis]|uniref:Uncharacterized protein n=1 Tax=Eimeria mitis TaxID=44415 RepID=U6JTW9_9EIME|nr:uncharacterized protein EMH_0044400 [Eimeria mitis]CDJ28834.1 hypothetical protein EMH_0044400 [Eimeria mitis]